MKIISQNVCKWSQRRQKDLASEIVSHSPDIACLVEHPNISRCQVARDVFADAGLVHHYHMPAPEGQRSGSICVFSRHALNPITLDAWMVDEPFRLIGFDMGGWLLTVAYWPQKQAKKSYWEAWSRICQTSSVPHLSIGDFNTGRNDIDKEGGGKDFYCAEYVESIATLGMVDVWRHCHGDKREYSYHHNYVGNGFRIDHAFASQDFMGMIAGCYYAHEVREKRLSDHSMLVVDLAL